MSIRGRCSADRRRVASSAWEGRVRESCTNDKGGSIMKVRTHFRMERVRTEEESIRSKASAQDYGTTSTGGSCSTSSGQRHHQHQKAPCISQACHVNTNNGLERKLSPQILACSNSHSAFSVLRRAATHSNKSTILFATCWAPKITEFSAFWDPMVTGVRV